MNFYLYVLRLFKAVQYICDNKLSLERCDFFVPLTLLSIHGYFDGN